MGLQHELDMNFNYEPIKYGEFKSKHEKMAKGKISFAVKNIQGNESVGDAMYRLYGKRTALVHRIARENAVYPTQTGGRYDVWTESGNHPSIEDMTTAQTFPQDFNFVGGYTGVIYICGMSVPPLMIKRIVHKLLDQGVFDAK